MYVWNNVRFADEPPRFGLSKFPNGINTTPTKPACYQVNLAKVGHPPLHQPRHDLEQGEDCLGLDIYVPQSNFNDSGPIAKLPVVVWIYGGAYMLGAKQGNPALPLYTGQSILNVTKGGAIFVAGNYRLGAFGFLAGNWMQTLTQAGAAQTNAGLYDQALLLQFVNKFIDRVGGDPGKVSLWGESAGASSILHHLIREDGAVDPHFQSFFVQSPAFEWSWDNSPGGTLDKAYQSFSQLADCGTTLDNNSFSCLLKADAESLSQANQQFCIRKWQDEHQFAIGPSVDNGWVRRLPALSLMNSKSKLSSRYGLHGATSVHQESSHGTDPFARTILVEDD